MCTPYVWKFEFPGNQISFATDSCFSLIETIVFVTTNSLEINFASYLKFHICISRYKQRNPNDRSSNYSSDRIFYIIVTCAFLSVPPLARNILLNFSTRRHRVCDA